MEQGAKEHAGWTSSKAAPPFLSFQIENTMFINKMKDQLQLPEKGCGLAPPHYPTLLTVPAQCPCPRASADTESKSDQLTPHSQASVTQNITVVPVPSTGLDDRRQEHSLSPPEVR